MTGFRSQRSMKMVPRHRLVALRLPKRYRIGNHITGSGCFTASGPTFPPGRATSVYFPGAHGFSSALGEIGNVGACQSLWLTSGSVRTVRGLRNLS